MREAGEILARLPEVFAQTRDFCHWTVRGVSTRSKVDLNKISLDWRILRQGRNGRKLWRVEVERPLLLKKKIAPTRKDT